MMGNAFDRRRLPGVAALLVALVAWPLCSLAQGTGIDPKADQMVKASMAYVAGLKQFGVTTRSSIEVVLTSGQKLQFDNAVSTTVQRPNKLRAQRIGDLVDQVFYYDGKTLTLSNPGQGAFASVAAPDTIDKMLDFAREKLDIVAPAGDFIVSNSYAILMDGVTTGFVVGKGVVEGVRCDHLAFRAPHVDWQIWIQEGAQPLPRKIVITTRDVTNAPQFEVVVTKWDLKPTITANMFTFVPPKGAQKVDFRPAKAAAPAK
jgi:hypothetical protein